MGLANVKWPARLEVMNKSPLVVIDGAHNIDGIEKLTESIDMYFNYNKIILILGILADKQVEEMIKTIVPKVSRVITVTPHSDRAELSEELKVQVEKYTTNCEAIEDYEEAYKKALSYCGEEDLLLVSGSLYMVGDMRKIISSTSRQATTFRHPVESNAWRKPSPVAPPATRTSCSTLIFSSTPTTLGRNSCKVRHSTKERKSSRARSVRRHEIAAGKLITISLLSFFWFRSSPHSTPGRVEFDSTTSCSRSPRPQSIQ